MPRAWRKDQQRLLKKYDAKIGNKLSAIDDEQIKAGAWPQYYIGAYPYCFRLPESIEKGSDRPEAHDRAHAGEEERVVKMGQAPGTHWYHAHKHGSTAVDVSNGMVGAFIIEGQYDKDLDGFYGAGWTRRQPVLIINQLGTVPRLLSGGNQTDPLPFSVNGRRQPRLVMRPGEVQLWRIVNASGRGGVYLDGIYDASPEGAVAPPNRAPFEWKQLAQDGVQFAKTNYDTSKDKSFLMVPGNRADLLVKAPENAPQGQVYFLVVKNVIKKRDKERGDQLLLLTIEVTGANAKGNQSQLISSNQDYPAFPSFLRDIDRRDVKVKRTVAFGSEQPKDWRSDASPLFTVHTVDGKKFDGNIGAVVLLDTFEEWKVENFTTADSPPGLIDHPFHIHVNPFQVVEVFDPTEQVIVGGESVPKFVFYKDDKKRPDLDQAQCSLDLKEPDTWKDCHPTIPPNIWWDVFPIPSGSPAMDKDGIPFMDDQGKPIVAPGYFKMRSRFADYAGQYVLHCHILAHEDRGMMTIVEVAPYETPYKHR